MQDNQGRGHPGFPRSPTAVEMNADMALGCWPNGTSQMPPIQRYDQTLLTRLLSAFASETVHDTASGMPVQPSISAIELPKHVRLMRQLAKQVTVQMADADSIVPEVSIIMPCLNEAETLATCVHKAVCALNGHNIIGEIIVADNGSTDGCQAIAESLGIRLVNVEERGYGNALMAGIAAARAKFIIMGDADDSYDFSEIPRFIDKLREGYDLVQGCRLPAGGGTIIRGAMPFLHRWWGNPMFSIMARHWFKAKAVHDVYCGMRGFTKQLYSRLNQRCTGMEFATEMIIKASLFGEKIAEVPITLYPDGRKTHAPHLKTFRDGWRTLRFFLMYSPRWLFVVPGLLLVVLGLVGYAIALPGLKIAGVIFDAHTLLFASLAVLCGYQSILFAIFTKTFAISEGLLPEDPHLTRFFKLVSLEWGLLIAGTAALAGIGLLVVALNQWRLADFGDLEYAYTMRWVIPGVTLTALGFQTILSSFFVSILGMRRK